jgi:ubiquinone/menaquinone biosynthesis C-methylase UbiE
MKYPSITSINKCRVCETSALSPFLHLPQMPLTDDFISIERRGSEFLADINVYICRECMTAQTQHNVEVSDYYEDYQYSVGSSATASRFMKTLAEKLREAYYPHQVGRKVLEIGSGDGGQLVAFMETGCKVLGYEPSTLLCQIAEEKGVPSVQGLFDSQSVSKLPTEFKQVDVVMLSYTFDHLPDPLGFLKTTLSILNKSHGLLVVEIHDLEKIIERQEFCLFEHEHSIYLTQASAFNLCRKAGFEIINFDLVPEVERRGNSLIFVATPANSDLASNAATPLTSEQFNSLELYDTVASKIREGIKNLDIFVEQVIHSEKKIAGYGAGGRGVMTLAAMSTAERLSYLVDRNPRGEGVVVPKCGIPLVGIDHLRSNPVDEILIFSFGYMNEIKSEVGRMGYEPSQFHSLLDVLAGRF